jgi:AraC-like DNA-binding protein
MDQSWVQSLAAVLQRFANGLEPALDPTALAYAVDVSLEAIDHPPDRSDNFVLSVLLLRTASEIVEHYHRGMRDRSCDCGELRIKDIRQLLDVVEPDARIGFRQWTQTFLSLYAQHHPLCVACVAAKMIRQSPADKWRIATLARVAESTPSALTRRFRTEFRIGIRDYQHIVRLSVALPRLARSDDKIEAIAMEVGYQSKKGFYHALDKWLHVTPSRVRHAPVVEQQDLIERLNFLKYRICSANVTRADQM